MKILHVSPAFYPAVHWGGPIFSTYGLCNALAAIPSVRLKVLTTDSAGPALSQRVRPESNPVAYPNGYEVRFTRRIWGTAVSPGQLMFLPSMIRWADVVHLTGTYSFPTLPTLLLARLFAKPLVWSPRGALQRWNRVSKPGVKRFWEILCNALIRRGSTVLHVTSDEEAEASARRMPKAKIRVIPNGVDIPYHLPGREWRPEGNLRLMYLGRLDPIKGIEHLLRALPRFTGEKVSLQIYGTGDAAYVTTLERLAAELNLSAVVTLRGHLEPAGKSAAFAAADLCLVPSFTENFGMTVAEALAHGVPVVASRGTPWSGMVEHGCGWWVDNSPEELAKAIREAMTADLELMGDEGRAWMKAEFSWPSAATAMHRVYLDLVDAGERMDGQSCGRL